MTKPLLALMGVLKIDEQWWNLYYLYHEDNSWAVLDVVLQAAFESYCDWLTLRMTKVVVYIPFCLNNVFDGILDGQNSSNTWFNIYAVSLIEQSMVNLCDWLLFDWLYSFNCFFLSFPIFHLSVPDECYFRSASCTLKLVLFLIAIAE
jgi:hypothetical protein